MLVGLVGSLMAGFGTASKDKPILKKGSDGKEYKYVICTASETGSYYRAGKKLANLLNNTTEIARAETTDGTIQNIQLITDGVCNVAFVQGDYLSYISGKDKSFFDNRAIIETDRKEHVQLIMRDGGTEDDLQVKGAVVYTGLIKSGGNASWLAIRELEDNYKKAKVVNGYIDISTLSDLKKGKINAIITTGHYEYTSKFSAMVRNFKGVNFVDFDDSDINDKIDFGDGKKPVYTFEKIKTSDGVFGSYVKVPTTKVSIIIDRDSMCRKQANYILNILSTQSANLF